MPQFKFTAKPYSLENSVQHYAWGTKNEGAFIPDLLGIEVDQDKPYAELWIGVHPNAPSRIINSKNTILLSELIESYPEEILGKVASRKFGKQLPFLFKVISAAEALSIQAHPNKSQAIELHKNDPLNYPDDNHKPEIAISIDELTALVGFRSYPEIIAVLNEYPELAEFIGSNVCSNFKKGESLSSDGKKDELKKLYSTLLANAADKPEFLEQSLNNLEKRLSKSSKSIKENEELFLKLIKQYGSDAGLWSLFLLNLVHLSKGQGIFLEAGVPHAYLKGNIIECMANSDNVVRAGLTPKFKDSDTLAKILDFECLRVNIIGGGKNASVYTYPSLTNEFAVSRVLLKKQNRLARSCRSIQVLLILSGEARIEWEEGTVEFKKGDVLMIPAALKHYTIFAISDIEIFQAEVPGN